MNARRLRWVSGVALATAIVAAAAFAGFRLLGSSPVPATPTGPVVPSARVTRGALTLTVHLRGDLRAAKQASLTAPAVGGPIRILTMVETGTPVEADAQLMEFDPADQQFALEQAESELLEAEQEIIKRRAEITAQEAQDKVTLLTAQFDVRRAELDAAVDEDLIAATTFKIRQAELQEARGNLERLKQDVAVRSAQGKASLTVLQEKKARSEMTATRARQNMQNLVLRAPMAGVVSVRENMDAGGGMFYEGMSLPAFRVGDTVYSGRPVLDVFDVGTLEVRARVNEQERANVAVGQTARLESDAAPDSGDRGARGAGRRSWPSRQPHGALAPVRCRAGTGPSGSTAEAGHDGGRDRDGPDGEGRAARAAFGAVRDRWQARRVRTRRRR